MIISYEKVVNEIQLCIHRYESHPEYKKMLAWHEIVYGMKQSIEMVDEIKSKSALQECSQEQLIDIKSSVESKLKEIEQENKVKIYQLSIDDICRFFSTLDEAKEALFDEVNNSIDSDLDEISTEIKPFYVHESQVPKYIGKVLI